MLRITKLVSEREASKLELNQALMTALGDAENALHQVAHVSYLLIRHCAECGDAFDTYRDVNAWAGAAKSDVESQGMRMEM